MASQLQYRREPASFGRSTHAERGTLFLTKKVKNRRCSRKSSGLNRIILSDIMAER